MEESEELETLKRAVCPGERIYEGVQHDWRLWKRDPGYDAHASDAFGTWPLSGHAEVWYCTQCRKIEERVVPIEAVPEVPA